MNGPGGVSAGPAGRAPTRRGARLARRPGRPESLIQSVGRPARRDPAPAATRRKWPLELGAHCDLAPGAAQRGSSPVLEARVGPRWGPAAQLYRACGPPPETRPRPGRPIRPAGRPGGAPPTTSRSGQWSVKLAAIMQQSAGPNTADWLLHPDANRVLPFYFGPKRAPWCTRVSRRYPATRRPVCQLEPVFALQWPTHMTKLLTGRQLLAVRAATPSL